MKNRFATKTWALIAGGSFLLAPLLFFAVEKYASPAPAPAIILPQHVLASTPVRINIPALQVDALVVGEGRTKENDIGTPKGPDEVAWFRESPLPGEGGVSILSGHYGWVGGRAAVFDNLHKLKEGDSIEIQEENGSIVPFSVSHLRVYGENEKIPELFENGSESQIALITCAGDWNKLKQSYSKRLIVFAERK